MHVDFHCLPRRVIVVAGNAIARHFAFRAVAGDAVRFRRHQHFGGLAALGGVMAIVAFHARMFRVVEMRLRHPAIDQDRFRHDGRAARGFYFVAKSAAGKIPAGGGGRLTVGLVRIGLEKHGALEFRIAAELDPQLIPVTDRIPAWTRVCRRFP